MVVAIVVPIVVGVAIIASAVLLVIVWRKRRDRQRRTQLPMVQLDAKNEGNPSIHPPTHA